MGNNPNIKKQKIQQVMKLTFVSLAALSMTATEAAKLQRRF